MVPQVKRRPTEGRKTLAVEAMVELAAEQNPNGITTAAIAKRMGLTQGSLFRHFPNKEAIWHAAMAWVAEHLLARIDLACRGVESPLAGLQAMFTSHVEFVVQHPGVPRMMFGELQRSEATPAKRMAQMLIEQYAQRLQTRIEQGKKLGELSASLDSEAAAMLFIGMIQGLVMQSLMKGDVKRLRRDAPRVFAVYRRGIEKAR